MTSILNCGISASTKNGAFTLNILEKKMKTFLILVLCTIGVSHAFAKTVDTLVGKKRDEIVALRGDYQSMTKWDRSNFANMARSTTVTDYVCGDDILITENAGDLIDFKLLNGWLSVNSTSALGQDLQNAQLFSNPSGIKARWNNGFAIDTGDDRFNIDRNLIFTGSDYGGAGAFYAFVRGSTPGAYQLLIYVGLNIPEVLDQGSSFEKFLADNQDKMVRRIDLECEKPMKVLK
jgi:hypothetical protein